MNEVPEKKNNELYQADHRLFQKLVTTLEVLPITAKILTESKIGKGINSIVKDGIFKNEVVNKQALSLVNSWKELVKGNKGKNGPEKIINSNRANFAN